MQFILSQSARKSPFRPTRWNPSLFRSRVQPPPPSFHRTRNQSWGSRKMSANLVKFSLGTLPVANCRTTFFRAGFHTAQGHTKTISDTLSTLGVSLLMPYLAVHERSYSNHVRYKIDGCAKRVTGWRGSWWRWSRFLIFANERPSVPANAIFLLMNESLIENTKISIQRTFGTAVIDRPVILPLI